MNKHIQIVQTICLIAIVVLLTLLVIENRYSRYGIPHVYDPNSPNKMHPGFEMQFDNLLNLHKVGTSDWKK